MYDVATVKRLKFVKRAQILGFTLEEIKGLLDLVENPRIRCETVKSLAEKRLMRWIGEVVGLLPNRTYAMHIHEHGSCNSPEASGGHFDPINTNRHGTPGASPGQRHAGDLPNIQTDENGRAKVDVSSHLLGTETSDFSIIGRSIVIHAQQDDYQSQPAGGSGEKIACGVIRWTEG